MVFVVYNDGIIFSKICLESGDFPRIDDIALLFHLQFQYQGDQIWGQSGLEWPKIGQIRDFYKSEFSTFCLSEPIVLQIIRNIQNT